MTTLAPDSVMLAQQSMYTSKSYCPTDCVNFCHDSAADNILLGIRPALLICHQNPSNREWERDDDSFKQIDPGFLSEQANCKNT